MSGEIEKRYWEYKPTLSENNSSTETQNHDKSEFDRKIVFENGREFIGKGFGSYTDTVCEVVFNTSMIGYQEILSDPSCYKQIICMTYPLIGNYGLTDEDYESKLPRCGGFIVREYNDNPSNYRYTRTLSDVMTEYSIPGIQGVETRIITKMIRDEGTMRALITDIETTREDALAQIAATPLVHDQVAQVSCKKLWHSRTANHKYNIVAVDCGIKLSLIRCFNNLGCNVTIVPFNTSLEKVIALNPDAVFFSDGPGDPNDVSCVIELVKALQGKLPIFGIGLGHQLIAIANGAKTVKLKFGHRGGNHPVRSLEYGTLRVTSQNFSYAVDVDSLKDTRLELTHIDILDNICQGVRIKDDMIMAVQFYPETTRGPQNRISLYEEFICMVDNYIAKRSELNA